MVFTPAELEYLHSQRLGRLATLALDGTLQNSPVGFEVDDPTGVITIYGRDMGNSRKFHNVAANGKVAFVVDDIASVDPWTVRCLEIRGVGEALTGQIPPNSYVTSDVIRIHPRRIISWGMGQNGQEGSKRNVPA
jgi:pyridoxamine 5'-phosphate oxidase family protein